MSPGLQAFHYVPNPDAINFAAFPKCLMPLGEASSRRCAGLLGKPRKGNRCVRWLLARGPSKGSLQRFFPFFWWFSWTIRGILHPAQIRTLGHFLGSGGFWRFPLGPGKLTLQKRHLYGCVPFWGLLHLGLKGSHKVKAIRSAQDRRVLLLPGSSSATPAPAWKAT